MTTPTHPPEQQNPVLEEYARLASGYNTRWSFYVATTTDQTLARLKLRTADWVLDVGCGTGALLYQLSLACPSARLCGIDPVPEMLAVARQSLPATVDLRDGWADRIPHDDGTFNVLVSSNMFHYIRQPFAALAEMTRVLKPGGQLVITDWCDDYLTCRLCNGYLRLFNRAHFKAYRSRECLDLLKRAGYVDAHIERYKISWLWGLMTATMTKKTA